MRDQLVSQLAREREKSSYYDLFLNTVFLFHYLNKELYVLLLKIVFE